MITCIIISLKEIIVNIYSDNLFFCPFADRRAFKFCGQKGYFRTMIYQAHKGVSTENPENTMPAFMGAAEQGYKVIELDVSVTSDYKFVLLHDGTINRTGRTSEGEVIPTEIKIGDITYEEALKYDFGIGFSKKFKGTKIPLMEEVLEFAKKHDIKLKIDNKYQSFNDEQTKRFFELLKPYEDTACLTCYRVDALRKAKKFFPDMHFHYDGTVTEEILSEINTFIDKEHLTVWLPHKNPATSWVRVEFANKELAQLIKKYGQLGVWILSDNSQLEEAEALGADIVETNGQLKPKRNEGIADMHTHSESSHDSVCKINDMYNSQKEKGTDYFAVTDHFDTTSFEDYDVFTPIRKAYDTVKSLNEQHGKREIFSGVEISEGFWFMPQYEKVMCLADYDVVIGSVHLVRFGELSYAYSQIDFSKLTIETVEDYLDAYFDDILEMLDKTDFDILAHLTCPLRYIKGKYGHSPDMSRYREKIEKILKEIIRRGTALEVNTSSYDVLNSSMPDKEILTTYRSLGGYLITLGSDAHVAENASNNFERAINELKAMGFENIYYYKNRRPYQMTIGDK